MFAFTVVKNYFFCLSLAGLLLPYQFQNKTSDRTQYEQRLVDSLIGRIVASEEYKSPSLEEALFSKISTDSSKSKTYVRLGRAFYRVGAYQRSIPYFKNGIKLLELSKDKKALKNAYLFLGNAHLANWNNEEALVAYYNALDVVTPTDSKAYDVIVQPNVAIILRRMRQSEQALKVCRRALEIIPDTRFFEKQNHVNLITITCDALIDLGKWKEVETLAFRGLQMSQQLGYVQGLVDIQTKLGAVAIALGDYSRGQEHLEAAQSILDASGVTKGSLQRNITYFKALRLHGEKQYQASIDTLETIIAFYNRDRPQNELRFIESFRLLAEGYKELGNQEKSIYWYEQYTYLNDEYQKKKETVVRSIYDRETAKLDEQIELLENETLLSKRSKWIIFVVLCVVILCFGWYLSAYKKGQKRDTHQVQTLTKKIEDLKGDKNIKTASSLAANSKEIQIDEATTTHILNGLSRLEAQGYYLKKECNLRSMARKIKTNATYLSYVINVHRKQSFHEYINELRIHYALQKIEDDKQFRSFSIKSIASELGYKSDYSFSKHFKRMTGRNPSQYIKQLEEIEG